MWARNAATIQELLILKFEFEKLLGLSTNGPLAPGACRRMTSEVSYFTTS